MNEIKIRNNNELYNKMNQVVTYKIKSSNPCKLEETKTCSISEKIQKKETEDKSRNFTSPETMQGRKY